MDAEISTAYGV